YRHGGIDGMDARRMILLEPREHRRLRRGVEGGLLRCHFVKNATEAEQIAAGIQWLTARLFGSHVGRSADDIAASAGSLAGHRARDPQVEQPHAFAWDFEEYVRGLHVAMD